jgi:methyl-accepting chemotaxis protein
VSSIIVISVSWRNQTLALRIFNNLASYSAQRLLSDNNNKLSRIFSRIASGERIQQTSDDSAGMMTAEALKSDVRTLRQDIEGLRSDVNGLRSSVQDVRSKQDELASTFEQQVSDVGSRVDSLSMAVYLAVVLALLSFVFALLTLLSVRKAIAAR